ncbi:hypothetical protein HW561_21430 [Rhodobacteraceae bacterium B1Z28]|uniref:Uncharacterized protein n=1 Tax=Ruegeria haliotis TaxID=2747601 RepID=A0ABX2PZ56_9RHOB|nr:hypothetical protein [Ruegeria haliotis]NVO58352.1 hypothetical protein [Ruegeria haliotis]
MTTPSNSAASSTIEDDVLDAPTAKRSLAPHCQSIGDVLRLIAPRIRPELVDTTGMTRLYHVADQLPAEMAPFWGLELRLGDRAPRADILWEIAQGNGSISALAGDHVMASSSSSSTSVLKRSAFWDDLSNFALDWRDGPQWKPMLGNVWLEVDSASTEGHELKSCLDKPCMFWGPNKQSKGSDRVLLAALPELGHRFFQLDIDSGHLAKFADALPEGATVFQMGVMGARDVVVTRLCLTGLDCEAAIAWLDQIGWPGDLGTVETVWQNYVDPLGEPALNIDLMPDGVGPKLGVELYAKENAFSTQPWESAFSLLQTAGLARPEKISALRDLPFLEHYALPTWSADGPQVIYPALSCNLHHLKLVIVGAEVIEAKAYVGVLRPPFNQSPTQGGEAEGGGGWR